jgi:phosphate transport system substrate-binding protein
VLPSAQNVENGTYTPLARPIFIYVNTKSLERPEAREFVEYYLANAPKLVKEVKYVPLPADAYKIALEHLKNKKVGTVFGGESDVGLKIEELLKREAKL